MWLLKLFTFLKALFFPKKLDDKTEKRMFDNIKKKGGLK